MFRKTRRHREWLEGIVEELAEPLRAMSYEDLTAKYLDEVDAFDFTRDGVWIQAEVEAWPEDRKRPDSRLIVSVHVSGGGGFTDLNPVGTLIWVDSPMTAQKDVQEGPA